MKKVSVLFIGVLILSACNPQPESTDAIESEAPGEVEETEEKVELAPFKVKLVEFSKGDSLPNQSVELHTAEGELISTLTTDDQGVADFEELEVGLEVDVLLESPVMEISHSHTVSQENDELVIETFTRNEAISVPVVMQEPALPTGCEITSLTAMLNYYGEPVTKEEMARDFLKKVPLRTEDGKVRGPDPQDAFIGDPTTPTGIYVFPQAVVDSAEKYALSVDKEFVTSDLSGSTSLEIEKYIASGVPVLMWITRELASPVTANGWWIDGISEYHDTFQNQHAVVLTGMDDSSVTIMDPLEGNVTHDRDSFFTSYESLGSYAMTLYEENSPE